MLKLVNITKDYVTKGVPTVHALKGLTVNFRRNEFVAILGASGCGKTTLLNIIGGLDRYTSGDLIIEGKSTKDYKDGDWDTYRNHSIGFVFQSYNLIPHQTVVKNVELALTIGGVDKAERRERALKALEKVGLAGMDKKRPNQLSGGQMQRVAIARALINEPEILLADEPTGALDSETSIQIMDLLKEVAKDCLVIMVTHNPDLANAYSNRIITMKDGLITSDQNPYSDKEEVIDHKKEIEKPIEKASKGSKKRSSMSFFTATGLSFSNLLSKLKRTSLIAVAGSIGIIGVSMVLSVSTGVHGYIDDMQNDMISQYPISIAEQSLDYTSLISGLSNDDKREIVKGIGDNVGLDSFLNYLIDKYEDITDIKTNDITEDLIEYIYMAKDYTNSINKNYNIDVTNNIFTKWSRNGDGNYESISLNGLTQMYVSELETVEGFSRYATYVDFFTNFMSEIPAESDYILQQYDILAGEYPKTANDVAVVVDENQTLTDLTFGQMGFFSEQEFINIARKAVEENKENPDPEKIKEYDNYPKEYKFSDILGKELMYYPHDSIWKYDSFSFDAIKFETTLPIDGKSYDMEFMFQYNDVVDALEADITASGYALKGTFLRSEGEKDETNPFLGEWAGEIFGFNLRMTVDSTNATLHFDVNSKYEKNSDGDIVVKVNSGEDETELVLKYVPGTDKLSTSMQIGGMTMPFTFSRVGEMPDPDNPTYGTWKDDLPAMIHNLMGVPVLNWTFSKGGAMVMHYDMPKAYENTVKKVEGYMYSANAQESWTDGEEMHISCILRKKKKVNFGCLSRGIYYTRGLTEKFMNHAKDSNIVSGESSLQKYIGSTFETNKAFQAYVTFEYTSYLRGAEDPVSNVFGYTNALNTDLSISLGSMFSAVGVDNTQIDTAYLRSLSGLATKKNVEIVDDVEKVSYEFKDLPQSVSIYPKDFKIKKSITKHLKAWNSENTITLDSGKTLAPEDRQELTYTDTVELIVSVINTMINVVTIALVAFTSLALVVSCFMIAVITYISTMERVKEIGVIRSLGGRKKDVSRLFVAETLIIGLASGIIGVGITYGLSLILNIIIGANFGIYTIANLPFYTALIMIALSILLNVVSGLVPSMKASNQDPVIALRTE